MSYTLSLTKGIKVVINVMNMNYLHPIIFHGASFQGFIDYKGSSIETYVLILPPI